MFGYKLKRVYFLLEWLNAYATTFFFTLIYFHLQQAFGFGNRENLLLSAASGFVYIIFAWQAGKVAQKLALEVIVDKQVIVYGGMDVTDMILSELNK